MKTSGLSLINILLLAVLGSFFFGCKSAEPKYSPVQKHQSAPVKQPGQTSSASPSWDATPANKTIPGSSSAPPAITAQTENTSRAGGPFYYKSWAEHKMPFQPVEEISLNEAKRLKFFYEAYFNVRGQIISFRKIFSGKLEWEYKYYYEDGFLVRGEMHKSDGGVVIHVFDKSGNLIR